MKVKLYLRSGAVIEFHSNAFKLWRHKETNEVMGIEHPSSRGKESLSYVDYREVIAATVTPDKGEIS